MKENVFKLWKLYANLWHNLMLFVHEESNDMQMKLQIDYNIYK